MANRNLRIMNIGNRFHDMQSQPGTGTPTVGSRELFEKTGTVFQRDTPPFIGNTD